MSWPAVKGVRSNQNLNQRLLLLWVREPIAACSAVNFTSHLMQSTILTEMNSHTPNDHGRGHRRVGECSATYSPNPLADEILNLSVAASVFQGSKVCWEIMHVSHLHQRLEPSAYEEVQLLANLGHAQLAKSVRDQCTDFQSLYQLALIAAS